MVLHFFFVINYCMTEEENFAQRSTDRQTTEPSRLTYIDSSSSNFHQSGPLIDPGDYVSAFSGRSRYFLTAHTLSSIFVLGSSILATIVLVQTDPDNTKVLLDLSVAGT